LLACFTRSFNNSNVEQLAAEGGAASLRQALAIAQQQAAAAVAAVAEKCSSLRTALADSEARIAEQQAELQSLSTALEAANTTAQQLKEEHAAAVAQAASDAAAVQTSSEQQQQLTSALDEKTQELASARAHVVQLEADAVSRCVSLTSTRSYVLHHYSS
jgi:chromosome segregation ATPase